MAVTLKRYCDIGSGDYLSYKISVSTA